MASSSPACPDDNLARGEKRLQVLQKFQRSDIGIAMRRMRSRADWDADAVIPWGPHPVTPSASPTRSKRTWEMEFFQYKSTSRRWAIWWLAGLHLPRLSANAKVSSTCADSD